MLFRPLLRSFAPPLPSGCSSASAARHFVYFTTLCHAVQRPEALTDALLCPLLLTRPTSGSTRLAASRPRVWAVSGDMKSKVSSSISCIGDGEDRK